jgi:uncharacterized protein (TIGR02145 family)
MRAFFSLALLFPITLNAFGNAPNCLSTGVVDITFTILTDNYPGETTWNVTDGSGATIMSGGPYGSAQTLYTESICVGPGNFTLSVNDSFGDGMQYEGVIGDYTLIDGAGNILASIVSGGNFGTQALHSFTIEPSAYSGGCTDNTACNYDSTATVDDGSCEFTSCAGCIDSSSCNYNPDATEDDGSCDYSCCPGPGCCTDGMYWDWDLEGCFNINPIDTNLDGCTDLSDLMDILVNYGNCAFLSCGDNIEYEGYSYSTVQIGDQCWFSENCRYLPEVSPSSEGSDTDPYYYVYDYQGTDVTAAQATANYETYGVLYNWPAVYMTEICPSGWRIPTDLEWQTMEMALGMSASEASSTGWRGADQGSQMKDNVQWNGSNLSGFSCLPGGYRYSGGGFQFNGDYGFWWSASESGSYSWKRVLASSVGNVLRDSDALNLGFSARCVRD